jgi:histone H3/H4
MRGLIVKKQVREIIKKQDIKASKGFVKKLAEHFEKEIKNTVKSAAFYCREHKRKTLFVKDLDEAVKQKKLL